MCVPYPDSVLEPGIRKAEVDGLARVGALRAVAHQLSVLRLGGARVQLVERQRYLGSHRAVGAQVDI